MIRIGNKRRGDVGEYVARPSPLGNPWILDDERNRNRVCDLYATWLDKQVQLKNEVVIREIDRLRRLHEERGDLTLVCFCVPKRCHAEAIKALLEAPR